MNKRLAQLCFITGILAVSSHVGAAEITVLPSDLGVNGVKNQWYIDNFRDISTGYTSITTAAITDANARSGNGSVKMSLTDGSGKADFAYNWGFVSHEYL